jgi:hypothetical protein
MAGLLDYLYDPSTFQGNGGLLSRLMPGLGTIPQSAGFPQDQAASFSDRFNAIPGAPQQFTPSGRSFDTATFDSATYAPNQAQPIAVGGYQMPRVGGADLYNPQQAMLPPNATLTQGQEAMPPPQMQQQTQPGSLPPALQGISPLARIFNPNGLIAKLTGNDTRSIAQQNLKAQYDALVPIVGPQKAMLAIMNPEAGKTILDQALSSKQKFTEIGVNSDGTKQYGFVNEREQKVAPYAAPGSESSGTVTGPDGKQIPIPPGVDRKTFVNEISRATADATTGKKTEVQGAAEQFANRMENAEKSFGKVGTEGLGVSGAAQSAVGAIPGVGNFLKTENFQKMEQAKREWVTALLRKESGAAIGRDEYTQYDRQFFPQPGDAPGVVAQKAEARRTAVEALKKSAGPSYKSPESSTSGLPQGWSVQVR